MAELTEHHSSVLAEARHRKTRAGAGGGGEFHRSGGGEHLALGRMFDLLEEPSLGEIAVDV
jgi:hypothetical protein